ncbi:hypothetical protein JXB41_01200 [Candidatus Woesearchaeota archaeon]|nr:hypothetical protein [Candidatus Woesearchaeota archaeon]
MNIFIHLGYTLIFSELLNLSYYNFILAFIFGVLVDLDHVFYYMLRLIKRKKIILLNSYKKTFVQEAIFYPVVILASIILKSAVPIIFFTLHIVIDYLFVSRSRPFAPFSKLEFKGIFNPKTGIYWIFMIASFVLFFVYFAVNRNYVYLLNLI